MKNLANCDPIEFFVQTGKIRKAVSEWLTLTKVLEIRKTLPVLPLSATKEEIEEIQTKQATENINRMLTAILEEYPKETAELLGLCCFIEPKDLKKHKMSELLGAFNELINDQAVLDFFTSLGKLGLTNISI